ncbi:MAG: hypothetical protein PHT12_04485 [Patescibacteria group bacterium]|nr:hypothetical protein [Patescibacteria group bacterium]
MSEQKPESQELSEVEKLKLAVLAPEEFSDEQVKTLFYELHVDGDDAIEGAIQILRLIERNRPQLYAALTAELRYE